MKTIIHVNLILLILLLPSPVLAEKFLRTSPEGAVYDSRTHRYEDGKVSLHPAYEGLRGEHKRKVYAMLGLTLDAGSEKWQEAQERWKSELDYRHALRVQRAQEYAQKRRESLQRPSVIYYQWQYIPYFRPNWTGYYFWNY
jgi:hypothetical protein|tara:strand:- start:85 stop:507 length:423 start_codon:yes stop_codon:yes gene_type:complete